MERVVNLFRWRNHPNAEKSLPDIMRDFKDQLTMVQHNFEILEKINSARKQGNVRTGQETNSKEDPQMNEPDKKHEPMEAGEIYNPPERRSEMKDEMDVLKRIKDSLRKCLDEMENYGKRVEKSFSAMKRRVAIQIYCGQKTDLTDYAVQELKKKLTSQLSQHDMELTMQICETHSCIERSIPLIVMCLSNSRLGVDFRDAVTGVPAGSNAAVLIFHHLKKHALPTQPSNTVLTEAEVKSVGIIIDVAFFQNMGLYDCDMNTNAYKTLFKFIEGHYEK